jgi:Lamin Tail Domain
VRNAGLDPPGFAWHVQATLQPESSDSLAARDVPLVLPPSIAPGDSVEGTCGWIADPGLFRLAVRLDPTDEVPDNDAAWAWVRVGAGQVVVNEIQFAPEVGETEWVELWNRDSQDRDLTGWTLEDASGRPGTFHPPGLLRGGAYGVASPDTTSRIGGLAPGTWRGALTPWNALNNSDGDDGFADQLVLRDANGVVQDALFYVADWSRERGRSLERLTAEPDVRGLLWAASKDPGRSTPGRVNSSTAPPSRGARVELHPNPFSPDGDGQDETLGAAIEVPEGYDGFRARIFDLEGRCRVNLAADRLGPGPRRLDWDGRDDGGFELPRGVYVIDVEFHSKSLAGAHERRTIGLVRP